MPENVVRLVRAVRFGAIFAVARTTHADSGRTMPSQRTPALLSDNGQRGQRGREFPLNPNLARPVQFGTIPLANVG